MFSLSLSLSVVSLGCCSHRPPQPHPPPAAPAPWPYNRASSFGQTLSVNGRKKAVISKVYKRTKHELKGCINDAKCMKYLLINKFKFPDVTPPNQDLGGNVWGLGDVIQVSQHITV